MKIEVLVRGFEGATPDGMVAGLTLTAGTEAPPGALEHMDRLGVQALEMKYPGIREARPVGEWTEYEMDLDD